jgi:hypothetical protein
VNWYLTPNEFGLTLVDSIDISDGCYQFNIVAVWRDENGKHYWDSDSGCSCPSPFEAVFSIDELKSLTNDHDVDEMMKAVEGESWHNERSLEEKTTFLNTVRESMR